MSNTVARVFPAKLEQLDDVLAFAEERMDECGFSMKTVMQVSLALEEAFVNVASYAYPDSEGEAELSAVSDDEELTFILSDSGLPFDPTDKEDPDITLPAEERGVGGLGILMVKKIMDEVGYRYENGRNVLTMKKKIC
ncbi:MAG: ATP-binding protein [Eubacteriales bacterium]|nr:ATP-binding protein [Eubacteriales bacterium]